MSRQATLSAAVVLTLSAAATTSAAAQQDDAITLPPVVVRPPAEEDQQIDAPSEGDPSSEPPPQVPASAAQSTTVATPGAVNEPFSAFPDLQTQVLGLSHPFRNNLGVLRETASLFDAPVAASIRSRDEITRRQAPDMFHALQNEVGVLMQQTAAGQASPFIRGLTGQGVLILIDGIRLTNSVTRRGPNQYFNTINVGMVEQIEVLRGQGGVLWGADAIGGVINVVTRSPAIHDPCCDGYAERQAIQYFNTSNSAPYTRLNAEGWVGRTGVFGGASYLNVRDLDTGFGRFGRQPGTNYQQYAGDVKFNYLLSDRSLLTVSMQHFEQEDLPRSDRFPGFPFDRDNSNTFARARFFDPQQRNLIYIRHQRLDPLDGLLDASTFTASYHRQREIQTRGVPTTRFQETDVETTGLNWIGAKDFGEFGKVTGGVDWYYDDVDSDFGGTAGGPIVPDDAWYRRAGLFGNWGVALTQRFNATLGVRYESIETAGTPEVDGTPVRLKQDYDDWIGSVSLSYLLRPGLRLVGTISEGFRPPNLDDLMANNPNVLQEGQSLPSLGLTPEHSRTYEVGLKVNTDRVRAQSFVYWLDLEDHLVSITAAPNTFATANQDSSIHGVEFAGDYLLTREWSLYGNFWHTRGDNDVTNAPLSRIPPTQGILGLRFRDLSDRHYLTVYSWMSDKQDRLDPVRDVTDERIPLGGTPGFVTLNLRAGRSFGRFRRHLASISLENLTDEAYLVHGSGVLGTGITARLGWSSTF